MAEKELSVLLRLKDQMTNGLQRANEELRQQQKEADKTKLAWDALSKGLKTAGLGMAAAGGAGLAMVNQTRPLNAQLSGTAITLGTTTDRMRDLTLSTTNVTFPLQSVISTFDLLTRAGVRDQEQLVNTANAFDALADATGSSAEVVADILIPAYKSLGEKLPESADEMDRFTWLTKNTTVDLSEFGSVMQYVAMYGEGLNVTIDDMIGIMAGLEAKGISGSAATRLFRTAVNEAKDGTISLNDALGLTDDQIAGYVEQMKGSEGITTQYADALNQQFGLMDKVKQKFSELTLKASGFLEPMEPLLAGMTGFGTMLAALPNLVGPASKAIGGVAGAIKNIPGALDKVGAGAKALGSVIVANPILAIVTAIALAAVLIWKNWDKIKPFFEKLWNFIKGIFEKAINAIKGVVETVFNAVKGFIETIWNGIKGFFTTIFEAIKTVVMFYFNAYKTAIETVWNAVKGVVEAVWGAIRDFLVGIWSQITEHVGIAVNAWREVLTTVWDAISTAIQTVWNAIAGFFTGIWNTISGIFSTALETVKGYISGAFDTIRGWIDTLMGVFAAIGNRILSALSTVAETIKAPFKTAWDTVSGWIDTAIGWFGGIAARIGSVITTVAETIKGPFKTAYDTISGWVGDIVTWFSNIPGKIGSAISGLASVIYAPFKSAVNSIIGALNKVIRGANSLEWKMPDLLGGFTIGLPDIPTIPYLARGGVIQDPSLVTNLRTGNPTAVIGEAGPEAVVPLGRMAQSGSVTYNITIQAGAFVGSKAEADSFANMILSSLRTKQRYAYGAAQF